MRKTMGIIILAIAGLMMLSVGLISAQEANTVSGIVTDATTGDPIEGAVVQVDGIDPVFSTDTGEYSIDGVLAGEPGVTASADGYESETVDAEVSDTEGAFVNFALQPLDEEPVVDLVVHDEGVRVAGTRRGFVGIFATVTVTGASPEIFSVMTNQGEIEIQIPDGGLEPITKTPGRPARVPMDEDRVAVLVEFEDQDGELVKVARQVIVKPTPQPPIQGAVVSITTDENGIRTLSIMRPDGTTEMVQLGPEGRAPDVGDLVTVFPGRGPDADGAEDQDRPPVVIGLVRAAEVSQRLEGFLEDLTSGAGEPPPEVAARRAQRVADLAARLEAHAAKHVEIMQRVSQNQNLPSQAVAGMLNGLERAQSGLDLAKTKATAARTRGGPPLQGGGQGNQNQGGANNQGQGRRP
ncbi:MAG: carboxypeptidase regulatory-like domain-containing protein [Chloroflexi bacterium]|nr:carboxypeptidase regulatory-like domain-containing protein [Chloroflexota bacterium]